MAREREVPLEMLKYFKYLNETAQRSIMRQLIDGYRRMRISPASASAAAAAVASAQVAGESPRTAAKRTAAGLQALRSSDSLEELFGGGIGMEQELLSPRTLRTMTEDLGYAPALSSPASLSGVALPLAGEHTSDGAVGAAMRLATSSIAAPRRSGRSAAAPGDGASAGTPLPGEGRLATGREAAEAVSARVLPRREDGALSPPAASPLACDPLGAEISSAFMTDAFDGF